MADTTGHLYPTEPLKCWGEAKQIREDYYNNFKNAHEKGGLRWAGGAWSFDAVPYGLGDDIYPLTGEPYGASIAFKKDFSVRCQEAAEKAGYARDLCSYMRNYWGSILLDEYAFGGPFPKPDFMWQDHICCSHAKWYQNACELEGGDVPLYGIDVGAGPCPPFAPKMYEHRVRYVADQLLDSIEWMESYFAVSKIGAVPVEKGMRQLFFMLTFVSIGIITDCAATSAFSVSMFRDGGQSIRM